MKKLLILNTGGTFNKKYNQISGNLEIEKNNLVIEMILEKSFKNNLDIDIKGVVFKDSLDMNEEDRRTILEELSDYERVIIVHGTDTIDITAKFLNKKCKNKIIVLTGAMMPYSIDGIEATSNLVQAITFALNCEENGIYISMHGLNKKFNEIKKNRELGIFQCQK